MNAPGKFGLKLQDIEKIISVFSKYPTIKKVIIYGSRAKGAHRPGSDIDLTIVGDLSNTEFLKIETALDDLSLPYEIDLSLFSQIENPDLITHIEKIGVPFFLP